MFGKLYRDYDNRAGQKRILGLESHPYNIYRQECY